MASEIFPMAALGAIKDNFPMKDADRFISKLRARIENDDDLTPSALAVAAGLDNSAVRKLLSGGHSARIATAEKICAALGTTLSAFMADDDSNSRNQDEIARLYSLLSPDEQRVLLSAARNMAASKPEG